MKQARLAGVLLSFALVGGVVSGCSEPKSATVERIEQGSKENTVSTTPLERGKERRAVLTVTRSFADAWTSSDSKAMKRILPKANAEKFTSVWDDYAEQGLKIKHVHDVTQHDVTEFNRAMTQATATYTYKDDSYLVDGSGKKVKSLPPVDEDATITLEKKDGEWEIVRLFIAEDSYR